MRCGTRTKKEILLLESALETTTLTEIQKSTLKARLTSLLDEYSSRAYFFSVSFNTFRITITVGSLMIPALLSVQNTTSNQLEQKVSQEIYWIVWVISIMVTISNGILALLKIDKKYFTLNTTYQHLLSESWQFIHLTGAYNGAFTPTTTVTHQNQYIYFCNKIEKIRMKHVEDEYYKAAEQINTLQEVIVPPSVRNRLPFQENSEHQVNDTTIRRNPQAQGRQLTPLAPIAEESANHE